MSLKYVILVVLSEKPLTGYQITKEFDLVLGNFWHATHQQVYHELKKMTGDKLIVFSTEHQTGKPDRKVYQLTSSGRAALERWLAEPNGPTATKNLFLVKLYACDSSEVLRRHITAFSAESRQSLQTYLQIAQRYYPEPAHEMTLDKRRAWLTLRYGIAQRMAQLSWAEEAEGCLFDEDGDTAAPYGR